MGMHKDYRNLWEASGYDRGIGSAAVVKPPSKEFIRLYHLLSANHALNDISLSRLKVARFSDVNDPFELMAMNLKEKDHRSFLTSFKEAYDAKSGLLCFSEDWTNPVLWSHYGAKHRGICLGFDVLRSTVQKVRYKDDRILSELEANGEDPRKIDPLLQKQLIRTKFRHWEYEQEWRRIVRLKDLPTEGGLHFQPFNKDLRLTEVILGPQCPVALNVVRDLAARLHPKVSVIKSRLAYKFFKVVPAESTVI